MRFLGSRCESKKLRGKELTTKLQYLETVREAIQEFHAKATTKVSPCHLQMQHRNIDGLRLGHLGHWCAGTGSVWLRYGGNVGPCGPGLTLVVRWVTAALMQVKLLLSVDRGKVTSKESALVPFSAVAE